MSTETNTLFVTDDGREVTIRGRVDNKTKVPTAIDQMPLHSCRVVHYNNPTATSVLVRGDASMALDIHVRREGVNDLYTRADLYTQLDKPTYFCLHTHCRREVLAVVIDDLLAGNEQAKTMTDLALDLLGIISDCDLYAFIRRRDEYDALLGFPLLPMPSKSVPFTVKMAGDWPHMRKHINEPVRVWPAINSDKSWQVVTDTGVPVSFNSTNLEEFADICWLWATTKAELQGEANAVRPLTFADSEFTVAGGMFALDLSEPADTSRKSLYVRSHGVYVRIYAWTETEQIHTALAEALTEPLRMFIGTQELADGDEEVTDRANHWLRWMSKRKRKG